MTQVSLSESRHDHCLLTVSVPARVTCNGVQNADVLSGANRSGANRRILLDGPTGLQWQRVQAARRVPRLRNHASSLGNLLDGLLLCRRLFNTGAVTTAECLRNV